ncbi:hypothetical protein IRZ71_20540 [Flavobacterium sp. ANB]|uniref:hypothetical protein n=1 Tax=unclassified Flavobacterium TaxID=196869 RepID=UPI0012B857D6|nr:MULTISPECIES: hypothetical protein [unclassified Flavobacterium]MBF4518750.1 hypothetical protein [Flavobacterium sp. ANB]MTD71537.1 hypothetical protein [Flavobacterium sp. LC2016-13]
MRNYKPEKLKLTKRMFLFTLALVLTNCQDNENLTKQEQSTIKTVSINDARAFLARSVNNPMAKISGSEIDELEFDKATLEKLNGSDQLLTVIPFATNNEIRNDRVLIVKIDDEIRSVIFSMQPDENSVEGSFSGKLLIYSLDGDFINGYKAKDGIIDIQYVKTNATKSSTSKTIDGGELKEVVIGPKPKLTNAVSFDMIWGSGGSSMGYAPVGGASGVTWDATGGGGSGSGITAPTSAQIVAELEKKIDGTKLDPCTKAILDKLKNLTQSDIANIMSKLGGKSEVYTLTFDIGNTNGNLAATNRNALNTYTTILDKDFLDGNDGTGINKPPTDLVIAAVIIHEVVHAYFFSLFDDKINSNKPKALDNFDLLYQRYVTKNYVGTDDAQHAQIWKSFINVMSSSLQEYSTGVPTNSPSQFYQDIILGTLMKTDNFAGKYPTDGQEYKRITNKYLTEKNNGNNDPEYTPKGKPCK